MSETLKLQNFLQTTHVTKFVNNFLSAKVMSGGANCAATSASLGSVLLTGMLMESISYDASNGSLWLVKDTPIPCLKDEHVLIKV